MRWSVMRWQSARMIAIKPSPNCARLSWPPSRVPLKLCRKKKHRKSFLALALLHRATHHATCPPVRSRPMRLNLLSSHAAWVAAHYILFHHQLALPQNSHHASLPTHDLATPVHATSMRVMQAYVTRKTETLVHET